MQTHIKLGWIEGEDDPESLGYNDGPLTRDMARILGMRVARTSDITHSVGESSNPTLCT